VKTRFVGAIRKVWSLKLNLIMPCSFPWKSSFKVKVPCKVAFLSWTATLGKILTIANLRRRRVLVLDCCYMYKRAGETVDHYFFMVILLASSGLLCSSYLGCLGLCLLEL
jgi:hypothetical protein